MPVYQLLREEQRYHTSGNAFFHVYNTKTKRAVEHTSNASLYSAIQALWRRERYGRTWEASSKPVTDDMAYPIEIYEAINAQKAREGYTERFLTAGPLWGTLDITVAELERSIRLYALSQEATVLAKKLDRCRLDAEALGLNHVWEALTQGTSYVWLGAQQAEREYGRESITNAIVRAPQEVTV